MKKDINDKVFSARGDVFGARGDVFNAAGDNPLPGLTTLAEVDAKWYAHSITDAQREEWMAWKEKEDAGSSGGGQKIFSILDNVLNLGAKGVNVWNTYKSGTTVEDTGYEAEINMGDKNAGAPAGIWYIAGAAVVLLIGIGVYVAMKEK
jgi:hypothetical protein